MNAQHMHRPVRIARTMVGRATLLTLLAALSACSTAPTVPSAHALPKAWKGVPAADATGLAQDQPVAWWRELHDPALTGWIELALVRNRDLVRSALRLHQASVQAERSAADAWPRFNSSVGTSAQQSLQKNNGMATTQVNGVTVPIETRQNSPLQTSANMGLSGSYEIDLWGRLAQNRGLAQQDRAMAQADLQTARWLLTTQVAEQYWNLGTIDAKLPLAQATVADAQAALEVAQLKLSQGKVRPGELDKAQVSVQDAVQRRQALTLQREQTLNTLALLLDEAPQDFRLPSAHLPAQEPGEPASWPVAAVLDRLPAVRRARLALDQALVKLQVAQSNRYPQLNLSAGLSSSGSSLGQVLANPFGSLGLNVALPMLDWTRLGLERDSAKLAVRLADMDFREALFKALAEVEQSYVQRRQWQGEAALLREKIVHAQQASAVAQLRYEQGADPLQSVRDAQASLRELQVQALELRQKAWLNQVAIYKAWGGPLDGPQPAPGQ
jgi:outer membrane protein TolC